MVEEKDTMILVNPQWQGGGDPVTYHGVKEFEGIYLSEHGFVEVPIDLDAALETRHGIIGYDAIKTQMARAFQLLTHQNVSRIFAVGGGCDADVPVIAYLNERYEGKLLVLWCDAHGDLNAPEESKTGLFYGMPARVLMGESGLFTDVIRRPLSPRQFIHIGGRDFDEAEKRFIARSNLTCYPDITAEKVREILAGETRYLYVHLDLDVLSPDAFPNTPLPVEGGMSKRAVLTLLEEVAGSPAFVGLGVYEYVPCGNRSEFIGTIVDLVIPKR